MLLELKEPPEETTVVRNNMLSLGFPLPEEHCPVFVCEEDFTPQQGAEGQEHLLKLERGDVVRVAWSSGGNTYA